MKLTDIKCKTAAPKEKPYKLADGGGMFLDIRPNGAKYWRLKYRIHGKEKLYALGVYPEVSLAKAREKRQEARDLIAGGIDPSLEHKKNKAISKVSSENTFEAIAREWHANRISHWTERYAEGVMIRLETYIFPEIGKFPIDQIEPPLLLQAIRKI